MMDWKADQGCEMNAPKIGNDIYELEVISESRTSNWEGHLGSGKEYWKGEQEIRRRPVTEEY